MCLFRAIAVSSTLNIEIYIKRIKISNKNVERIYKHYEFPLCLFLHRFYFLAVYFYVFILFYIIIFILSYIFY